MRKLTTYPGKFEPVAATRPGGQQTGMVRLTSRLRACIAMSALACGAAVAAPMISKRACTRCA